MIFFKETVGPMFVIIVKKTAMWVIRVICVPIGLASLAKGQNL